MKGDGLKEEEGEGMKGEMGEGRDKGKEERKEMA